MELNRYLVFLNVIYVSLVLVYSYEKGEVTPIHIFLVVLNLIVLLNHLFNVRKYKKYYKKEEIK